MKCGPCAREEGALQWLGEKIRFLVGSADLSKANMSGLNLLLEIFVLDVEMFA
jgi:hypothetical protein